MQVHALKHESHYGSRLDRQLEIQTFGERNDYPQTVLEIVGGSSTGAACVELYAKFIGGKGFVDQELYKLVVNQQGLTNDALLELLAKDYAMFGGFYVHVNYNMNYKIIGLSWIPFEHVRLGSLNDDNEYDRVAIHWDWGRRFGTLKNWKKEDIDYIDRFNPDPVAIEMQVALAGGWDRYKGQVYVFAGNRHGSYPLPSYSAALTDMSTEQGIANAMYRNARNNFFPAGILVNVKDMSETEKQEDKVTESLMKLQGDENVGKYLVVDVKVKEEAPIFLPMSVQNYDKEFQVTEKTARERIGRSFSQPPILRAENIGAGFGADLIENAYRFYNSITSKERLQMERVFTDIYKHWWDHRFTNFQVATLIFLAFAFVIADCLSAWRLSRRLHRKGCTKNGKGSCGKFRSDKMFNTVLELIIVIPAGLLLAFWTQQHLFEGMNIRLPQIFAGIVIFWQLLSILENESSCNGKRWAKVLQKILIDKTERHFDVDLSDLKKEDKDVQV